MIHLKNKTIDEFGHVILPDTEFLELLYSGFDIAGFFGEDTHDVKTHNRWVSLFETFDAIPILTPEPEDFHSIRQNTWFLPEHYRNLNVESYIINLCKSPIELDRVNSELLCFKKHKLFPILQCLIYLVEFMRDNNIVWGVGRGSSCSSYCLFLIGIHKVDSIKYNLNFDEFLV